ncbi:MAG: alpha/beta fold hydrolase [Magnetococcales bacterium]|nr:alpha/beta fold hydrolase [Magnetococcales bacterium]
MAPGDVLDHPLVLAVLFHPRREGSGFGFGQKRGESVSFPVAAGVAVGGRLHRATAASPLLVLFHGNGEIAEDYDDLAPLYLSLGISFLVVDFRGYGRSDGAPTSSALLADSRAIREGLRGVLQAHGIEPTVRIFVMGRSLGSAAGLEWAVGAADLSGLILESAFADTFPLIARLGCPFVEDHDESEGFGNLEKVARVTVPTLVIHGVEDWIIPVADGRALAHHSGADKKWLITVPEAGHNDLMLVGRQVYFQAIRQFVLEGEVTVR